MATKKNYKISKSCIPMKDLKTEQAKRKQKSPKFIISHDKKNQSLYFKWDMKRDYYVSTQHDYKNLHFTLDHDKDGRVLAIEIDYTGNGSAQRMVKG